MHNVLPFKTKSPIKPFRKSINFLRQLCNIIGDPDEGLRMSNNIVSRPRPWQIRIGQVGMTSLQVNWSLAEVNALVFIAVF